MITFEVGPVEHRGGSKPVKHAEIWTAYSVLASGPGAYNMLVAYAFKFKAVLWSPSIIMIGYIAVLAKSGTSVYTGVPQEASV